MKLDTREDCGRVLALVVNEVLAARMDPRSANAITGAVNVLLGHLLDEPGQSFADLVVEERDEAGKLATVGRERTRDP